MNQIDLKGRVAVVTGGAQGIGRAVSERLSASGAIVDVWDVDGALAREAASAIGSARAARST
jgi:3-oxoacyl-[acyl-carrier protein] reductase